MIGRGLRTVALLFVAAAGRAIWRVFEGVMRRSGCCRSPRQDVSSGVITLDEIKQRWIVMGFVEVSEAEIVESFRRVEMRLGRAWLDETLVGGMVGPTVALAVHTLG